MLKLSKIILDPMVEKVVLNNAKFFGGPSFLYFGHLINEGLNSF